MYNKRNVIYLALLLLPGVVLAAFVPAMDSTNYAIESDSINIGGTENSTSTNYRLSDTIGEAATGISTSTNYTVYAGYRHMTSGSSISISSPDPITMTPALDGFLGGQSNGAIVWTVTTNSPGGYMLVIKSSTNPSLASGGDNFPDYTPAGANPDFTWTVANTVSRFGFTPEGGDILTRFKDDGALCNNGGSADLTLTCWDGMSMVDKTIASRVTPNNPGGTATTVNLRAEIGNSRLIAQPAGTYTVVVTATATVQ